MIDFGGVRQRWLPSPLTRRKSQNRCLSGVEGNDFDTFMKPLAFFFLQNNKPLHQLPKVARISRETPINFQTPTNRLSETLQLEEKYWGDMAQYFLCRE